MYFQEPIEWDEIEANKSCWKYPTSGADRSIFQTKIYIAMVFLRLILEIGFHIVFVLVFGWKYSECKFLGKIKRSKKYRLLREIKYFRLLELVA